MTRKTAIIAALTLVVVAALALVGCGQSGTATTAPAATTASTGSIQTTTSATSSGGVDGKVVYADNCAVCHGPNGEGGIGPTLRGEDDQAQVEAQVRAGGSGMTAFEGVLTDEEIAAVAQFVVSSLAGGK